MLALLACGIGLAAAPGTAQATEQELSYRIPISVSGYEVKQTVVQGPRPSIDGHITHMEVDVVDADGTPVPIQRLMLHHIVFLNVGRSDQTCDGIQGFDSITSAPGFERFFALGEERAQLSLPPGYGYRLGTAQANPWAVLYMVMNHRSTNDQAFIEYTVTVDDDPAIESVVPFWLDVNNCKADPIYNVDGDRQEGARAIRTRDFPINQTKLGAAGGNIVAGAGHVHGGAYRLKLTQPACGDRRLARSLPTWGDPDHPFYNVRPILHEPGPIHMSAFKTPTGFPVRAGESLRLSSIYDDSRPHTRVMGIMIVYIDPDSGAQACGALPNDVENVGSPEPGRTEPVPFEVPLTGLDEEGQAVTISHPPGELEPVNDGATIRVDDNFFNRPNVKIDRGDTLNWSFGSTGLHNVTLANGPEAIGSPNLSQYNGFPRVFSRRFREPGTYRLFCALHPVQMTERVVVRDN